MNWAEFALAVSGVLVLLWVVLLVRRNWAWSGLYASIGLLIAACFNAAAPVRGIVDPDYVGYTFGVASSQAGIGVTVIAGAIFLLCAVSAMLAVSRQAGRSLWLVAFTCAAMLMIIGVPTVRTLFQDPAANAIQFGEYLTIPGLVASGILIVLLTLPFAVGAVWASRAATRGME